MLTTVVTVISVEISTGSGLAGLFSPRYDVITSGENNDIKLVTFTIELHTPEGRKRTPRASCIISRRTRTSTSPSTFANSRTSDTTDAVTDIGFPAGPSTRTVAPGAEILNRDGVRTVITPVPSRSISQSPPSTTTPSPLPVSVNGLERDTCSDVALCSIIVTCFPASSPINVALEFTIHTEW